MADLSSLLKKSRKPLQPTSTGVSRFAHDADDSDFGDEVGLTAATAAEKARKKKSLRFYTSQIAQKANKREGKGRTVGGDDDIPYRERLKDRQARRDQKNVRHTSRRNIRTMTIDNGRDMTYNQ